MLLTGRGRETERPSIRCRRRRSPGLSWSPGCGITRFLHRKQALALLQEPTAVAEGIRSRDGCRSYVYHCGRDRRTTIRTRQLVSDPWYPKRTLGWVGHTHMRRERANPDQVALIKGHEESKRQNMTLSQKAVDFTARHQFSTIAGCWALGIAGAFGAIMRNPCVGNLLGK